MVKESTDIAEYYEHMEHIESDIMDTVITRRSKIGFNSYSEKDVLAVLSKDRLDTNDFAILLSPAAESSLEKMAIRAKEETRKHFGNSVNLFTPLYVSNYCENQCIYCGFNSLNKIQRAKLSAEKIDEEMRSISNSGLTEILILTGESRKFSDIEYIGDCVKIASKYFRSIGVEVYPMNASDYSYLQECGADYVTVFQETYDPVLYADVHKAGPKRIFSYRFNAQERALIGGMRGVAFGALLGLGDFRKDVFACGVHAYLLQRKYPHAEISLSFPRLRPFRNGSYKVDEVNERELLQAALACRIFMPFVGETISSRETSKFRDNIVGICATRISAGVDVGIGGHAEERIGDGQFDISDPRSVKEIRDALMKKKMQPVFNDYVRV
jgi:thiazole biosynthesis protein ThiH